MSDDEVVASDVPRGTCLLLLQPQCFDLPWEETMKLEWFSCLSLCYVENEAHLFCHKTAWIWGKQLKADLPQNLLSIFHFSNPAWSRWHVAVSMVLRFHSNHALPWSPRESECLTSLMGTSLTTERSFIPTICFELPIRYHGIHYQVKDDVDNLRDSCQNGEPDFCSPWWGDFSNRDHIF